MEAIENVGCYISFDAPLAQDEESNMYDVLLSEDTSSPDKDNDDAAFMYAPVY